PPRSETERVEERLRRGDRQLVALAFEEAERGAGCAGSLVVLTRSTQDLRERHPDVAVEDRALRIPEDRDGLACRTDRVVVLAPGGMDERSCAPPGRLGNEVILGRDLEGHAGEGLGLVEPVELVQGASEASPPSGRMFPNISAADRMPIACTRSDRFPDSRACWTARSAASRAASNLHGIHSISARRRHTVASPASSPASSSEAMAPANSSRISWVDFPCGSIN